MNLRSLIQPRSADEQTSRQEELVNILSLAGTVAGLIYLAVLIVQLFIPGMLLRPASFVGGALCAGLSFMTYSLSRSGQVRGAAVILIVVATIVGTYVVAVRGSLSVAVVTLAPAVVFAGIVLSGPAAIAVTVVEIILYIALALVEYQGWISPQVEPHPINGIAITALALFLLNVITLQTVRVLESFLHRTREREQALRDLTGEKDELLEELQDREAAQRQLLETVRELGSPIIPLAEDVIAMPLIGTMDQERVQHVTTALLEGVAEHRARVVIVDITGVPVVDTALAGALLKAAQGVRLLGAEPVLTGIRAEVAQTIVAFELDLSGIITRATLQEGLDYALAQPGQALPE